MTRASSARRESYRSGWTANAHFARPVARRVSGYRSTCPLQESPEPQPRGLARAVALEREAHRRSAASTERSANTVESQLARGAAIDVRDDVSGTNAGHVRQ